MSGARDPYEVLGVPRTASTRRIRAAYVSRARLAHPDLVGSLGLDVMRALNVRSARWHGGTAATSDGSWTGPKDARSGSTSSGCWIRAERWKHRLGVARAEACHGPA